jgi:hypothetical protein
VGTLVTLDQVYEVQHTALDSDVQASMARVLDHCEKDASGLLVRVAKAVALLEIIQETAPTDARLVAQCLYDRLDRGSQISEVTEALETLRRDNLLGYSEKTGYKLQSSAAEEWERERRDIGVAREVIGEVVQDGLKHLLAIPERPRLQARPFPWAGVFSDGRRADDVTLVDPRDEALVRVDFRFVAAEERVDSIWVKRSDETVLRNRLVWVVGDIAQVDHLARELSRSRAMVRKYKQVRESLNPARKLLLQQEENRAEDLDRAARDALDAAWMAGKMFFRSRVLTPSEHGASFATSVHTVANRILPELFPHFVATQVAPSELMLLLEPELSGPPPKFLGDDLGILELDGRRYVPSCSGVVARRVQEHIEAEGGLGGGTLLAHFGGPPYGHTADVVKACVAGLLRGSKVRIQPEAGAEITAVRDAGVREIFEKDRSFRRATLFPAGEDDIGLPARARICKFFEQTLGHPMDREDNAIADAVAQHFPTLAARLRDVLTRHRQIPGAVDPPPALVPLDTVLEKCVATARQTKPTVKLLKKHLDVLLDGVQLLRMMDAELTPEVIRAVRDACAVRDHHMVQLRDADSMSPDVRSAAERIDTHLGGERPWREIASLAADLERVRTEYTAERKRLLQWQNQQCDHARATLRARPGFSTLTADQSHSVLRPIAEAMTNTSPDAVAPSLGSLKDPFLVALHRAESIANERLDEILSEGDKPVIRRVDLGLRNRELGREEDVRALIDEIEKHLLAALRDGVRVRLV